MEDEEEMAGGRPSSSSSSLSAYYSYGVMEYLLLKPITNHIVHKIFLLLPISPPIPLRLAKTLHLRRLFIFHISEQSLLSLELLHEINLSAGAYDGNPPLLPLIQSAYLHAAVGSTLAPLIDSNMPDFFDAVRRIWMMRVDDLSKSESKGLVTDGLIQWKSNMEAALDPAAGGSEMRDRVLIEWRVDVGMKALKEYLAMELEVMGKTALEMAIEEFFDGGGAVDDREPGNVADGCVGVEMEGGNEADGCVGVDRARGNEADGCDGAVIDGVENAGGVGKSLDAECIVLKEGVEDGTREEVAASSNGIGNGNRVEMEVEGDPDGIDVSSKGIDTEIISVSTPEVNKVKDNLKRSREDLQNVVEDPLPNAKKAASRVIASRRRKVMLSENCSLNEPEHNQNAVDVNEICHSAEMGTEVIHNESIDCDVELNKDGDVELNKDPKKVLSPSLMDRNPTARTCGWEDESIGSESDSTASPAKNIHLSTPTTIKVSPLKPVQFKKVGRRRKKWRTEEVDALRAGVDKHGVGNWILILKDNPGVFDERTKVDLKDKWRNLTKS